MALPVLDKTWLHDSNNVIAASGSAVTDHRTLLLAIKTFFIGAAGVMPVRGSSDSVNGALDAVDRWAAAANLVWDAPGSAHSWIVLGPNGGGTATGALCIDCTPQDTGVQGPLLTIVWSPSDAFVGGTQLDRPTAPDEVVILNGAQWVGTSSASPSSQFVWHGIYSDDRDAFRIVFHYNSVCVGMWIFDLALQDPATGLAADVGALGCVSGSTMADPAPTYARLFDAAPIICPTGAADAECYLSTQGHEGAASGTRLLVANEITGEWPLFATALVSETVGARGQLTGYTETNRGVWDLFFGSTTRAEGDTYPAGVGRLFVQFGDLVLPWDGSVPVIA